MFMLVLGLILWSVLHTAPVFLRGPRAALMAKWGRNPYRGGFSLGILLSLVLMVFGYRGADSAGFAYIPPDFGPYITNVLMLAGLFLFVVSAHKTNVKRVIRHPQMVAVILWSIAHLLSNGNVRDLVLFGWLGLWAALEIVALNKRDGAWQKPDPVPAKKDIITVVAGLVLFGIVMAGHEFVIGVAPHPGG
ncbi:MAG: NnrU family protein [Magnetospiraceae bacterium]